MCEMKENNVDIFVETLKLNFQGSFFFSCIWAVGGILKTKDREKFSVLFRGLVEKEFPLELMETFNLIEPIPPPMKPYIYVMPKDNLVFDYRFIKEVKIVVQSNFAFSQENEF